MSKHSKALIIESPGLQRPLPRSAWALATMLFWAAWFWLWLPLLSIIGWAFGIYTVFDQFVVRWGYIELLRLLPYYLLVIGVSGVALVGWSLLQYHRFHGKERRKAFPVVSRADIAKSLGLTEETTVPWAAARRMVAHHDENGRVSWVEVGENAVAAGEASPLAITAEADAAALTAISIEPSPLLNTAALAKASRTRTPIAPLIVEPINEQDRELLQGDLRDPTSSDSEISRLAVGDDQLPIESLASENTIGRFAFVSNASENASKSNVNEASGDEAVARTQIETSDAALLNTPNQSLGLRPRRKRRVASPVVRRTGHFAL